MATPKKVENTLLSLVEDQVVEGGWDTCSGFQPLILNWCTSRRGRRGSIDC